MKLSTYRSRAGLFEARLLGLGFAWRSHPSVRRGEWALSLGHDRLLQLTVSRLGLGARPGTVAELVLLGLMLKAGCRGTGSGSRLGGQLGLLGREPWVKRGWEHETRSMREMIGWH